MDYIYAIGEMLPGGKPAPGLGSHQSEKRARAGAEAFQLRCFEAPLPLLGGGVAQSSGWELF